MTQIYQRKILTKKNLLSTWINKSTYLITLLFTIFIISCSQKFVPVSQENIEVSGEYAVLRTNTTVLAVREFLWAFEPKYLPDSYTTFHIRIQNRSKEPLKIEKKDFYLIDQNSLQYDLVSSDDVLQMMLQDASLIPDRFTITAETQRENALRINEIRRNISMRSFIFGDIHPGAFKEGIIYFHKLDSKSQEFKLVYKGTEIIFKKSKN